MKGLESKIALLVIILLTGCTRHTLYETDDGLYHYVDDEKCTVSLQDEWYTFSVVADKKLAVEQSEVNSIIAPESAFLNESNVRGSADIANGARIVGTQIDGPLEVKGGLEARDSHFVDPVYVEGPITSQCSFFMDHIHAKSDVIVLESTQTQSICIEPTSSIYQTQLLCIKQGSVVDGDITFTSGRGQILLDHTSFITGIITGAHFIQPSVHYENVK